MIDKGFLGPVYVHNYSTLYKIRKMWFTLPVFTPTWNCIHSFKSGFVVDGGGFYIHRGNKSENKKNVRKKLSFMHTKRFNKSFKRWVQFRVDTIPHLP